MEKVTFAAFQNGTPQEWQQKSPHRFLMAKLSIFKCCMHYCQWARWKLDVTFTRLEWNARAVENRSGFSFPPLLKCQEPFFQFSSWGCMQKVHHIMRGKLIALQPWNPFYVSVVRCFCHPHAPRRTYDGPNLWTRKLPGLVWVVLRRCRAIDPRLMGGWGWFLDRAKRPLLRGCSGRQTRSSPVWVRESCS